MAEMIPWRFLIVAALFAVLIYCQFYLAHRQWSRLKGEQAVEIDVNYVRSENYFGQSFRMKVKQWLLMPGVSDQESGTTIQKDAERIHVVERMELPSGADCDDILVVERNFSCGSQSRLGREVLVHGDAEIGAKSRVQALATDSNLFVGEGVRVARWLDAMGDLTISAGTKIQSRVTSQTRISLGLGVELSSAHAPEIATAGRNEGLGSLDTAAGNLLDLTMAEQSDELTSKLEAAGFKPDLLLQLGSDTWMYKGDLVLTLPVRLSQKLAVTGKCSFCAGSRLEADLRAGKSILLGPSCVINGNLTADRHIFIGNHSRFSGVLNAGHSMLLSSGTRGFRSDGMVVAYAGEKLSVESDVAVKGKLSAGAGVVVVNSTQSRAWKARFGIQDATLGPKEQA